MQGIQSVINHFLSVQFNQLIRELAGLWTVNTATVIFLFHLKDLVIPEEFLFL